MRDDERTTLKLELDTNSEPISGRMAEENGADHPFVGWLGFASVLHRVLGASRTDDVRESRGEDGE